jgi:electron transport complex protein RnfG
MRNKIWYMALVLGVVGFVAGLGLAGVKAFTDPLIEKRVIEEGIKPTLDKFLGPAGIDNDPIQDRIKIDLGEDERGRKLRLTVFKAKKSGKVIAAALQTSAAGFGGNIDVLTVLDLDAKKILGVKALAQSETPGLGARVGNDEEPFIKQFSGMVFASGVKLSSNGGEVDAISGASISSGAFTRAVDKAVDLLGQHGDKITAP